jgi:hypothetical protein
MRNLVLLVLFVFALTGIIATTSPAPFPRTQTPPELRVSSSPEDGWDEDKKKKKKKDGGEEDEEDYRPLPGDPVDMGA